MQSALATGFSLIMLGGIMEGAYSFPLRFNPKWSWENTWGAGSLMALVLIPWPLAFLTVPDLSAVYRDTSWTAIVLALLFGAGWGAGGIFTGLGIDRLGFSVGLSVILGLIALNGSLIPLLMNKPAELLTPGGVWFLGATVVMLFGMTVCALAGRQKETTGGANVAGRPTNVFAIGLTFSILSGVLSGLVNFALIFGTDVIEHARRNGAGDRASINALWALVFTSNYLVNLGYCVYLLLRNRSAGKYLDRGTAQYWLQAAVMGSAWAGGVVLYGMGAAELGTFGAFVGFPVLLITSIVTANVLGWATGEWKGAPRQTVITMLAGVGLLLLAILILANANRLMSA
jgi:L-rhamnose-H+ transport protein